MVVGVGVRRHDEQMIDDELSTNRTADLVRRAHKTRCTTMLRIAVGVALVKVAEAHGQMNVSHLPAPLSRRSRCLLQLPAGLAQSGRAVCAVLSNARVLWQTPASWQDHYSEHAMRCGKNCGLNPDPVLRKDVRPH